MGSRTLTTFVDGHAVRQERTYHHGKGRSSRALASATIHVVTDKRELEKRLPPRKLNRSDADAVE